MNTTYFRTVIAAASLVLTTGIAHAAPAANCAVIQSDIAKVTTEFVTINTMRNLDLPQVGAGTPDSAYLYDVKKGALLDEASLRIWSLRQESLNKRCADLSSYTF